jgi:guanylate kinase
VRIPRGSTLFIVAAPSGAGKSSLVNAVLAREPEHPPVGVVHLAAAPARRGHGEHYHFVSPPSASATWSRPATSSSSPRSTATSRAPPGSRSSRQLEAGHDVLLEIDWQGAQQVRAKVEGSVSCSSCRPRAQALEQRMRKRAQDSEEVIARRLAAAREEMSHFHEFDYVIVNEDFDTAVDEIEAIFVAQPAAPGGAGRRHAGLIANLLAPE